MNRNTKKVEQAATRWAAQEIDQSARLSSFIDSNDRTLSTDGHVDIYASSIQHSVGSLAGRVSVQVKGTRPPSEEINRQRWKMEKRELKALQALAPVIYIIAYVRDDYSIECGSYSVFTSFRLTTILNQMADRQVTKNVRTYPWPSSAEEIEKIFLFAHERGNQISGITLETLTNVQSLQISSAHDLDLSRPFAVRNVEGSAQVVARLGGGQLVDLDMDVEIVPAEYVQQRVQQSLRSENVAFDSYTVQRISPTTVMVKADDGVRLEIVDEPSNASYSLNLTLVLSPRLSPRIRAIQFYIDVLQGGRVWIGCQQIEVSENSQADLEDEKEYLHSLIAFKDDVEALGGNPEWVGVEGVSVDERKVLARWGAFSRGEVQPASEPENSGRVRLAIGSSYLELLYLPGAEGASGKVIDYFDASSGYVFALSDPDEKSDSTPFGATPFDILHEDDVLKNLLNIKFDDVLEFYGRLDDSKTTESLMANTALRFWRLGYEGLPNSADFMRAARDIAKNLISRFPDSDSIEVRRVNYWALSCEISETSLSDNRRIREDRRSALRAHVENGPVVELVYAVILRDQSETDALAGEVGSSGLDLDPEWPIWTFLERRLDGSLFSRLEGAMSKVSELAKKVQE